MTFELAVQKSHFEHVVDARVDLQKVERFADEVLGPGLQSAELVAGLSGQHDDGQVAVKRADLQAFHDAEAVKTGHFNVQQDQVVGVLAVQGTDLLRIEGGADVRVAGFGQHTPEDLDMGVLIVHDEDAGCKNVLVHRHGVLPAAFNSSQ